MCYGPDVVFKTVDKNINCDISKDEKKVNFDMNVKHPVCSDLNDEKHWKYQHGEADISDCEKVLFWKVLLAQLIRLYFIPAT